MHILAKYDDYVIVTMKLFKGADANVGLRHTFDRKAADAHEGDSGYWSVCIDDLPAGFHYVNFYVDGVEFTHPRGRVAYGGHKLATMIE